MLAASGMAAARAEGAPEQRPAPEVQAAFDAVLAQDNATLKRMLDGGLDVNVTNEFHLTLVDAALRNDQLETIELLLNAGFDPNRTGLLGDNLLDSATLAENLPLIKLLLAHGADPYQKDEYGGTPLETAAGNARALVLQAYADAGIDLAGYRNDDGNTLLHTVADYYAFSDPPELVACARLLLQLGLEVDSRDADGETPLYEACAHLGEAISPQRLALIEFLIASGADPNSRDSDGTTPLKACVGQGSLDALRRLVELGADVNAQDAEGESALKYLAGSLGSEAELTLLLELGADPNLKNNAGETPLHEALWRKNTPAVEALIAHGALVDLAVRAGRGQFAELRPLVENEGAIASDPALATLAVRLAVKCEYPDIARYLIGHGAAPLLTDCIVLGDDALLTQQLKAGADPNALPDGRLPLYFAAREGRLEAIRLLAEHGGDVNGGAKPRTGTPLIGAVRGKHLDAVRALLALGADTEAVYSYKLTPLFWACMGGDVEIAGALLDAGAHVDALYGGGDTPLLWAAGSRKPSAEMIQLLVAHGANVNAQNDMGLTPLGSALGSAKPDASGGYPVAEALLAAGADPNIADEFGYTPLTSALSSDDLAVAEFLLKRGADPDVQDLFGWTALLDAIDSCNQPVIDLLRRYHATEPSAWLIEEAKRYGIYGDEPAADVPAEPVAATTPDAAPAL